MVFSDTRLTDKKPRENPTPGGSSPETMVSSKDPGHCSQRGKAAISPLLLTEQLIIRVES